MKSINSILTEAVQKIADEHGVVFKDISIKWIDASSMNTQKMVVESISSSHTGIIEPCENSDD